MTARLHSSDPVLASFAEEIGDVGPVAVQGNQTRWNLGGPLLDGTPVVSAPSGIVDYIAEEMVVVVRAGTSVAELHETLAASGQWTALPERGGTVGGAVVVGENDYRRPARGDLRSSVLQVRYVSAEGLQVAGGGPTVKNVSGFDLPRLITGSLGTLGCLSEVILRTNPIPSTTRWLRSTDADPFAVHAALLAPGAVLWDGATTTVMLYGHEVAVDADVALLARLGTFETCPDPGTPEGHRWSLKPSDLTTIDRHDLGTFMAEVGIGTVHAERPQPPTPLQPGVRIVHDRMKLEFDPTWRLNPGRVVGVR